MSKKDRYTKETIKEKRRFPVWKTMALFFLLATQILCITAAVLYIPRPQDRIERYELTATPREDGTVDLDYRFVWTPLDDIEPLTWVEIGMPSRHFDVRPLTFSTNIASYETYTDGDYVSLRLYLDRPYSAGETLTFSFGIHQRELLCQDPYGYFYEFVPGWFNETPVEAYRFVWKLSFAPTATNAPLTRDGYAVWEGAMPCGTYVPMRIQYTSDAFANAHTVRYEEFYDGDVYNALEEDKVGAVFLAIAACIFLLILQLYMIDSVVSYHRGRGFLTGYGHHVHIYGYSNPKYRKEKARYAARSGGRSGGGGGCACACACACAGGGRAGCSQKDTHRVRLSHAPAIDSNSRTV